MIELGAHAEFILSAYAGVFLGLFALIGWTIYGSQHTKHRLRELGDAPRTDTPAQ